MKPLCSLTAIASIVSLFFILPGEISAHSWMAPEKAAAMKNPVQMNAESAEKGKVLFAQECAYCHGEKAEGMSEKDSGLKKRTPDLVMRLKNHSEGDFHWKIQKGRGEMPSFENDLSEREIWHILNYLKTLIEEREM